MQCVNEITSMNKPKRSVQQVFADVVGHLASSMPVGAQFDFS
jgi:hypothetical protein